MTGSELAIDTNTYSDWQRGRCWEQEIASAETILVPFIVVAELLGGFARGTKAKANQSLFHEFLKADSVRVLYADRETLTGYSKVYEALQSRGRMIPTNDIWIAAICLQKQIPLATADIHFEEVPLLERIAP